MQYILIFLVFSVIGWCIDTAYRTIAEGHYSSAIKYPFDPIYGLGAVVLSIFYASTSLPIFASILSAGILMAVLEYFVGILYKKILKKRLWDYSLNAFNLLGHTDLLHTFYWILLSGLYYWLGNFFPLF